jgi:hypothetical protein
MSHAAKADPTPTDSRRTVVARPEAPEVDRCAEVDHDAAAPFYTAQPMAFCCSRAVRRRFHDLLRCRTTRFHSLPANLDTCAALKFRNRCNPQDTPACAGGIAGCADDRGSFPTVAWTKWEFSAPRLVKTKSSIYLRLGVQAKSSFACTVDVAAENGTEHRRSCTLLLSDHNSNA